MKASLEEMEAVVDVFKERLNKMNTTDLEASAENLETVAACQEVPNEEAAVETIRLREDQHGVPYLAVGCHRQLKRWTQGSGGSWQNLAST
jgi:hypothetical protein